MKYLLIDNLELVPLEGVSFQIYSKKQDEKGYLRVELGNGRAYEYEIKSIPIKDEEKTELYKILVKTLNSRSNPISTGEILTKLKAFFLKESTKLTKRRGRRKRV